MKTIARWARKFGVARAVCIVLLFALVPLRLLDPRPLEEVRLRAFDLFQVLRPREQTALPVVIVDIDEASLKDIGQSRLASKGKSKHSPPIRAGRDILSQCNSSMCPYSLAGGQGPTRDWEELTISSLPSPRRTRAILP